MNFSFHLWDKGVISFDLPVENGGVITSQFFPSVLSAKNIAMQQKNPLAAFLSKEELVSDPNEVRNDLSCMIAFINQSGLSTSQTDSYFKAIDHSVKRHIDNFGRLFFTDLCSYINIACHIMATCGFSSNSIRDVYLYAIFLTVDTYGDNVKDGGFMGMIVPFSTTSRYNIVVETLKQKR